jgi:hypothetical protein
MDKAWHQRRQISKALGNSISLLQYQLLSALYKCIIMNRPINIHVYALLLSLTPLKVTEHLILH